MSSGRARHVLPRRRPCTGNLRVRGDHLWWNTFYFIHLFAESQAEFGVGRSKLAAASEKALGVSMTDRNWRTVQKIIMMAEEE